MSEFCKSLKPHKAATSCMQLGPKQKTSLVFGVFSCDVFMGSFCDNEVGDCGTEHSGGGTKTPEDPCSRAVLRVEPLGESTWGEPRASGAWRPE